MSSLLGLTLHRPWPWAILHAGKRLENRPWYRASLRGQWIAIHAGKKWDEDGCDLIDRNIAGTDIERPVGWEHTPGQIVGVARVGNNGSRVEDVPPDQAKWFMGPCAWVLEEVVPFAAPIDDVRGKQGLWKLTDEQADWCRSEFAKATSTGELP